MNVVGYVRVSTTEQGANGAGMEAQRQQIHAEVKRRHWTLVGIEEDVASGGSVRRRPGLDRALVLLEQGDAAALLVAKLDRLSRSLVDFATLVERSRRKRWELVVLDLAVDTTTPNGEAMAGMLAVFAQWERRMIGQRTRDALAVKRAEGVVLGRPRVLDERVRAHIRKRRRQRWSFRRIAAELNEAGMPTAHDGQRWWPSTVRAAV